MPNKLNPDDGEQISFFHDMSHVQDKEGYYVKEYLRILSKC